MAKPVRTPPEIYGTQHEIYEAVAREIRAEGFHITLEDVVRAHEKMEDGQEPGDIVGRQIADTLRRRLPARPVAPATAHAGHAATAHAGHAATAHAGRWPEAGDAPEPGRTPAASLPLRLPPDVQAALAQAATQQNLTLEQAIVAALRRVYGPPEKA